MDPRGVRKDTPKLIPLKPQVFGLGSPVLRRSCVNVKYCPSGSDQFQAILAWPSERLTTA